MIKNSNPWYLYAPVYTLVMPHLLVGAIGISLFFAGIIPPIYLVATLIMWCLISGLGIAVGYHRIFSHKTHNLPKWKENLILFFAVFAGQGTALFWVAVHRGYHHSNSDREKDLHSPVIHGKWHAFLGWLNYTSSRNNTVNLKYAIDLIRKPNLVWFHNNNYRILFGVPLLVALFDWKLAFAAFYIPTFISLLQDNGVNVFGHIKGLVGYRNFQTNDQSYNNFIFGYLGWGQGWHNNHHYNPKSFDFGSKISNKWWEFDPCRLFLPFIGEIKDK